MSINAGSDCIIAGDWNRCPADAGFEFQGEEKQLYANLSCPFDSVRQSGFIASSQEGLCECEAKLASIGVTEEEAEDINCNCFACPPGFTFGFAYECDKRLVGPCTIFNCNGLCNGDLDFGGGDTFAPTAAPTSGATYRARVNNYHDANMLTMSSMTLLALGLVFRTMMIH